jgi:hypothetical protein
MTMTMTRLRSAPPDKPAAPARGSAQRVAVISLVLAIIFQPVLHPTGPGNSSPVDLFIVAAIVTALVWLAGTHQKLRAPYVIPVALFVAAGAASGLVSELPSTALVTLLIDLLLFAWCTTVVNVLTGPRAMRYALVAWSWSGIFWAALFVAAWAGHITPLEGINPAEGNRLAFTFGDPNYASWFFDATIFVLFASRTPGKRWMRFVGYGVLVWALVLTESNGGVLALGLGISFLLMVRYYRRHGWPGVIVTGLIIGLTAGGFFTAVPLNSIRQWALYSGQPLLVNSIGRSAQSSSERGLLVQETIELYQRSDGLVGLGPMADKQLLAQRLPRRAVRARHPRAVRADIPVRLRRDPSRAGGAAAAVGADARRRARPGGPGGQHARDRRQLGLRRGPALPPAVDPVRGHRGPEPRRVAGAAGRP